MVPDVKKERWNSVFKSEGLPATDHGEVEVTTTSELHDGGGGGNLDYFWLTARTQLRENSGRKEGSWESDGGKTSRLGLVHSWHKGGKMQTKITSFVGTTIGEAWKPIQQELHSKILAGESSQWWSLRKARPADAAALVADLDASRFQKDCFRATVKDTTADKSARRADTVKTFAGQFGSRAVTEEIMMKFMYLLFALDYSAQQIEDYRSAWVLEQKVTLPESEWWTQSQRLRLAISGLKKKLSDRKQPRGLIYVM